jgi:hypothetical protein
MAALSNPSKSLRLRITLADQETLSSRAAQHPAARVARKLVAQAAIEHFDRKDATWWPFVRLVVYRLTVGEARELVEAVERLIRGESQGFSFRSQVSTELGLQLGRGEQAERFVVEAGVDLQGLLGRLSGARSGEGEDLALFRFGTTMAELVSFASELKTELRELSERDAPAPDTAG